MKRPWTNRTSLFARMSLLFGLLATGPLIISAIVLSLSSWRGIRDAGEEVAQIGKARLEASRKKFHEVASETVHETTNEVASLAKKRLDGMAQEATRKSSDILERNTKEMSQQGMDAVSGATRAMGEVSRRNLTKSFATFQKSHQTTLNALSANFRSDTGTELSKQTPQVEKSLRQSVLQGWKSSAERRAASVEDGALRAQYQVVQNLQYPLRTSALVRGDDAEAARKLFESQIRKDSHPPISRVVLLSPTGMELARVPETEAEDDWENHPSYTRFRDAPSRPSYMVEPARLDREGRWVRRIIHAVPSTDATDNDGDPPAMMMTMRPPTNMVLVDIPLQDIVTEAITDPLPKSMEVLVVRADSGVCISTSSSDRNRTNRSVYSVLDQLKKAGNPEDFVSTTYYFDFANPDKVQMQGAARYWSPDTKCWTVVLQPNEAVFQAVRELRQGFNGAVANALDNVKKSSPRLIQELEAPAKRAQRALMARAAAEMKEEESKVQERVKRDFQGNQRKFTATLQGEMKKIGPNLVSSAGLKMQEEADAKAATAANKFGDKARAETAKAGQDIEQQARQRAGSTAARMLANSTWLIPLFLVLALFLATLTARSLVKPINQLVQGTQSLAAGDYSRRISVRGDDELARLALAFNHMAGAIERGQTELQQSHDSLATEKARIEGIVQASPDGLVMLEPCGRIVFMNPTAVTLLGLRAADVPDEPFDPSQLPPHGTQALQACLQHASEGGVQEYELESPQRVVLQLREVNLQSSQGRSYGRLLHLHDITRERVIDEMKSDFISLVSHELRTPLTSILGFSSYMLTGKLGAVADSQKLALDSIHRQAKRLSAIISDFLDISRIESGKIEMKKESVPVTQVAGRVVEDLRPQANEKHVQVSARVEEGSLPLVAAGDEQRIAQVFTNLIGNALKFTEPNGRVDVTLARHNGEVICKVADTGCGIPPDELEKVFDRFYQVEKVVTRKSGGTGLGLAIVKNIIEAHGGRVWIESEVGHGTQVSFTLPGSE